LIASDLYFILRDNGYPENIINSSISKKIKSIQEQPKEGPQKCPIYLLLLWIGNVSLKIWKQIKLAIKECYSASNRTSYSQPKNFYPESAKIVPTTQQNMVSINKRAAVTVDTWAELR